ncbi:hypothetical protein SCHIN_v1c05610 [Spiroplasma chinense]|uniref:MOLPALP family lipoprotein n=1 Tax=Spiroplasma chinense TaxID=216932 RepID=A0A5B9Y3M5_9MOLU|nr:MOLPALP family lipoprotein [Spiroplasma chinense]QEH61758.1 hypothetical protein SCHIN_v1c05610 [Spiroplasma chinense]
MKKLLSILGAMSITASASASVVACGPAKVTNLYTDNVSQETIAKLMSQYAKGLYLNQNGEQTTKSHISSSEVFNNMVKDQYLDDLGLEGFDESLGISKYTRFNEVASNFINTENLTSKVEVSERVWQGGVVSMENQVPELLQSVVDMAPSLIGALANPAALAGMLENLDISAFIQPEVLKVMANVLTEENFQLIENAFSNDVYENMSVQQSLDSSVIGLANAMANLTGTGTDKFIQSSGFDKDTLDTDLETNYNLAINSLIKSIGGFMGGSVSIKFDLVESVPAVAEILRFVRTLLVYLNSFTYEDYTNAEGVKAVDVKTKRDTSMNEIDNTTDIKKLLDVLKYMVNDQDGNGVVVLKNVLGILAATSSSVACVVSETVPNTGVYPSEHAAFGDLITKILFAMTGMSEIVEANPIPSIPSMVLKVNVKSFLRDLINSGANMKGKSSANWSVSSQTNQVLTGMFANTSLVTEPLKSILEAIKEKGDSTTFKNDWVAYLWDNDNEALNMSIKGMLDQPLSGLMSLFGETEVAKKLGFDVKTSTAFDFLLNKSLKTIVNDLSAAVDTAKNTEFNFDDITKVIQACRKDDALVNALRDPENLMSHLGLVDGKVIEGSVLDVISKTVGTYDWLVKVLQVIQGYLNEGNNLAKLVKDQLKEIKVETTIKGTNTFVYTVSQGDVTNTFEIAMKQVKNKLVIDKITLVD